MSLGIAAIKFAAKRIGCEPAVIRAVDQIESAGHGMNTEGTPKILFEGHKFSKFTGGRFDSSYPKISYPRWTKKFYGRTQADEYERLLAAAKLDAVAAHMSTSWGRYQIMGFNFALCGFADIWSFVDAMRASEDHQLESFVAYVQHTGLDVHLRNKDFTAFARGYNGADFWANRYDEKLGNAYQVAANDKTWEMTA